MLANKEGKRFIEDVLDALKLINFDNKEIYLEDVESVLKTERFKLCLKVKYQKQSIFLNYYKFSNLEKLDMKDIYIMKDTFDISSFIKSKKNPIINLERALDLL